MKYNIKENGDALEKEAFEFIQNRFPNYELVWQIYLGNKGNATIAKLPNYPYNQKRENFAENSYTVLESSFIIDQLIKSEIFIKSISSFNDYLDFMKSFITFFACLGRLHDTV
jgi:hypothetical protein